MTDKKTEALKQALEALENAWLDASMGKGDVARHTEAITAIREALAEQPAQQQEPDEIVRWVSAGTLFGLKRNKDKKTHVLYGEKTKVARIQISIKVIK